MTATPSEDTAAKWEAQSLRDSLPQFESILKETSRNRDRFIVLARLQLLEQELSDYRAFYQLDFNAYCLTGLLPSEHGDLVCHAWLPSLPVPAKATAIVLHGLYDHVGLFHHNIRALLNDGHAVIAMDMPGHGVSAGEPTEISDFAEYRHCLDRLIKVYQSCDLLPKPFHAIGQSTGGAIVMGYILLHDDPFDQVILLAPLIRAQKHTSVVMTYHLLKHLMDRVPRKFNPNSADAEFLDFLQQVDPLQARSLSKNWVGAMLNWSDDFDEAPQKNRSLLVIQGDSDSTVDHEYNVPKIVEKFGQVDVVTLEGGQHHLANEAEDIRTEMLEQISKRLLNTDD